MVLQISRSCPAIALVVVAALVSSCSKSDDASTNDAQLVARVGSDVVTIQELETEFRIDNVPPERRNDPDVKKKAITELVTRKALARRALTSKFDREPAVLLELLRARDQVLANTVLLRDVDKKLSAIQNADVEKFIANNPMKFANRQMLQVEQITVAFSAGVPGIIDRVKDMKSIDEVDQKLTELGVPHGRSVATINTAETPDELTNAMRTQRPEDILFVRAGQNGLFLKIKSSEPRPLTGPGAEALARQLMRMELLKSELSMASFAANLEAQYVGDYAKFKGAAQ